MYEPVKDTRFGIAYRLNTAHTVKGHHRIKRTGTPLDASYDADATMTLPDQWTLSAYHKINDKFGVSGTARWTKWDVFDVFTMHSTKAHSYIPEHWNNVWTYSAGLDYYHNENWTFRVGYSYDPTPIKNAFLRTARIPDSDRYWVTLGASYKKDKWTVDVGYSHLFMQSGQIYNRDEYTILNAKSKSLSNMYAVQLQYDF
jgi:long-chain fatty acid transport protein